jgi:hypothetical protein
VETEYRWDVVIDRWRALLAAAAAGGRPVRDAPGGR